MKKNKLQNSVYKSGFRPVDLSYFQPLQVIPDNRYSAREGFEYAFRNFKSMVQKEKIISLYKEKQQYEKPSVKKRRKQREAQERRIAMEIKQQLIKSGEWEKRMRKREEKKFLKQQQRAERNEDE